MRARISGMRDVFAHEYGEIDYGVLWLTRTTENSTLIPVLGLLVDEAKGAAGCRRAAPCGPPFSAAQFQCGELTNLDRTHDSTWRGLEKRGRWVRYRAHHKCRCRPQ